jgi:hypothetical protein
MTGMLSESARMASAAEARFRIQAPNSRPRAIKVIGLDAASEPVVKKMAEAGWKNATFFVTSAAARAPYTEQAFASDGWLTDLQGRTRSLMEEVGTSDLVVMIAGPGGHAEVASIIGEACSLKRIMTTALVVGGKSASEASLSMTLAQVRPWSLMVVLADADDYVEDMLTALRA